MPILGLGVFKSKPGEETKNAVSAALAHGYRAVDTAAYYKNETDVGAAIAEAHASDTTFVTTKLWPADYGYDAALRAFDQSERYLGAVDLLLLHWPRPEMTADTWQALETIYNDGRVRAIGVSNFEPHHLEELAATASIVPALNQVELHPYLQQRDVREYCVAHGIAVEGWSPIAKGAVLNDPVIGAIAEEIGKSAVQVTIRWHLQQGFVTIPKSVRAERIQANADVFDFTLSDEQMARIDSLDKREEGRIGPHPDRINFG